MSQKFRANPTIGRTRFILYPVILMAVLTIIYGGVYLLFFPLFDRGAVAFVAITIAIFALRHGMIWGGLYGFLSIFINLGLYYLSEGGEIQPIGVGFWIAHLFFIAIGLVLGNLHKKGARLNFKLLREGRVAVHLRSAGEAKRDRDYKFQALFNQSHEGILLVDLDGKILDANQSIANMLGYDIEELIGKHAQEINVPEEKADAVQKFNEVVKGEKFSTYERRVIKKNGSQITLTVSPRLIVDPDGDPLFVQSISRDLEQQKQSELALEKSEYKYRALFNQSNEGITIVNLDGYLIDANQRVAEMLGYDSPDELIGKHAEELTFPEEVPETQKRLAEIARGETPPLYERMALKKDGTSLAVEIGGSLVVDRNGNPIFIQTIVRDITFQKAAEQALIESEFRYKALFNQSNEGVTMIDPDGYLIDANPTALEILGYEYDELIGLHTEALSAPEEVNSTRTVIKAIHEGEKLRPYKRTIVRKDGTRLVIELSAAGVNDQNGNLLFMQSIFRDITQQKLAEDALRESEFRYRALFNQSSDGVLITDMEFNIVNANPKAAETFGYPLSELIGQSVVIFGVDEEIPETEVKIKALFAGEDLLPYERTVRTKDGSHLPVEVNLTLIRDQDRNPLFIQSVFRDITTRKKYEQRLRFLATHDQLTGLPNRALFFDRLKHSLSIAKRYQRELAILFLDLDGFKSVNDVYGHSQGDRLLEAIGQRLGEQVRESDTIARIGGDEFTMIIQETSGVDEAKLLAGRILEALNQPFQSNGHEITITGSIGISLFPKHGEDPEELVGCADKAMYAAKKHGKNTVAVYGESSFEISS